MVELVLYRVSVEAPLSRLVILPYPPISPAQVASWPFMSTVPSLPTAHSLLEAGALPAAPSVSMPSLTVSCPLMVLAAPRTSPPGPNLVSPPVEVTTPTVPVLPAATYTSSSREPWFSSGSICLSSLMISPPLSRVSFAAAPVLVTLAEVLRA